MDGGDWWPGAPAKDPQKRLSQLPVVVRPADEPVRIPIEQVGPERWLTNTVARISPTVG